jgi:hypothetical protein
MNYTERREAYGCDVTYVTNVELGFDYLRDNLALTREETVLRERPLEKAFCLVDEADSILIDEARTPLIISKQISAPQPKYGAAKKLVDFLKKVGGVLGWGVGGVCWLLGGGVGGGLCALGGWLGLLLLHLQWHARAYSCISNPHIPRMAPPPPTPRGRSLPFNPTPPYLLLFPRVSH